jgi:hypothetical protein
MEKYDQCTVERISQPQTQRENAPRTALIGAVAANAGAAKLGSLEVPCSRSAVVASQVQTVQTMQTIIICRHKFNTPYLV